jgi:RNase P/RNase MRP subunit POP5
MDAIWNSITKLYGEYGASQTALSLIDYDTEKKQATIRVANAATDIVRAALATITKTENKAAAIHVQKVSGTIKALRKKTNS